jgi:hypothetical protein
MEDEITNTDYPFKDAPLTIAGVEYLALELFPGKLVELQVLERELVQAHVSRGGKSPQPGTANRLLRRVLSILKQKGLAENPVHGHWRFPLGEQPPAGAVAVALDAAEPSSTDHETTVLQENLPEPIADRVLGSGSAAVYLYYLPVYRFRAEEHGEKFWPCKIGRTDRDPVARVLAQAATALPENPHIALVIRTSFALAWENALHGVLTLRGRRIEDVPGAEWFLTSPDEVYELAIIFDPRLSDDLPANPAQRLA